MSNKKKKKLTPMQQEYQAFAKEREPQRPVFKNCIRAFLVGGLIWVFINYFNFTAETAGGPTSAVLIILSIALTGFGVLDHIAQWAGAGTAVPITGFANTMASAAIEHRSEGYVLGVGSNMFKIAGPVIVYGVFSAFVVAIVKMIIKWLGGM